MVMSSRDGTLPAGWAVRVTTEELIRGQPLVMLFAAAISGPSEAEEAVKRRDRSTPNETVKAVSTLSKTTLDRLGLTPGDVGMLS